MRRYVPEWCATRDQAGYAQFRSALKEYEAFMGEADDAITTSFGSFNSMYMCGGSAEGARRPLYFLAKPALDDADQQISLMLAVQTTAFKDHPRQAKIAGAVGQLRASLVKYQESRMRLETLADDFEAVPTLEEAFEPCAALAVRVADEAVLYVAVAQAKNRLLSDITSALAGSDEWCEGIDVTGPIPDKKVKKAGAPTTEKSGGAVITFPKTLDVGKKPRKLPVDVKSPASGYGTFTVTNGRKGIVATGGQVTQGSFGLLMTIPAKTKTGKVTVTFALEGGPSVKGAIRLT